MRRAGQHPVRTTAEAELHLDYLPACLQKKKNARSRAATARRQHAELNAGTVHGFLACSMRSPERASPDSYPKRKQRENESIEMKTDTAEQQKRKRIRCKEMTQQILTGYAKELLELLDSTITEKFKCYEPLRKYIRAGRDPLMRTVLKACLDNEFRLVIGYWSREGDGIEEEHEIGTDEQLKKLCNRLRGRLRENPDRKNILAELGLPPQRIYTWTRKKSNHPRFGDIVRLADMLGYYIKWYDTQRKRYEEVF